MRDGVLASTPPSVDGDGVGRRPGGNVPKAMLLALVVSTVADDAKPAMSAATGCAATGRPLVVMPVRNLCGAEASEATPPGLDGPGSGKRSEPSVPVVIFAAFVVSVVALAANPAT
jgi:hypothetical protein